MFRSKPCPFEQDIEKVTDENNLTEDWGLIMHICDNVVNYSEGAKICLKAIIKRLNHNVPRVVLQALILLDACVKNCDRKFLLQVASSEFTAEVRKLLGKMHPSTANKLKELLQKWSLEDFKDDSELCIIPALYYKLKSEGVEFPEYEKVKKVDVPICTDPDAVTSQEEENDIIKAIEISLKDTGRYSAPVGQNSQSLSSETDSKTTIEPFKVRAIYDFDAAEENELTIKTGEIVVVLENSNTSWWKGSNHRGEGLFPANFVSEDLDVNPEPEVKADSVTEVLPDSLPEEIKIDEEKINAALNWLIDVDPSEETPDPEEMLKLEQECHKMTPLIEEKLNKIDNRLAKLNLVNDDIMGAFDLYNELSNKYSTLPSNMAMPSPMMQIPYAYQTLPHSLRMMPPNVLNFASQALPLPVSSTPVPVSSQFTTASQIPAGSPSQQSVTVSSPVAVSAINQPVNPPLSATSAMNPYSNAGLPGGVYVPPNVPIPFPPNSQQGGFASIPGNPQCFYPYQIPPVGQFIPSYPYYINPVLPPQSQSNISPTTLNPQTQSVSLSTTTSVSNVLSSTPLPSATSYHSDLQQISTLEPMLASTDQSSKPETVQNLCNQPAGDGHISTSNSSSSDNS